MNKENITKILNFIASIIQTANLYLQQSKSENQYVGLTSSIVSIIVLIFSSIIIHITQKKNDILNNEIEKLSTMNSARVEANEPIANERSIDNDVMNSARYIYIGRKNIDNNIELTQIV